MKTLSTTLVFLITGFAYCQSNFNEKGKVPIISEDTYLLIEPQPIIDITPKDQSATAFLAGVLPAIVDYGVTTIKELSKKRAASFAGEYKCANSGQNFYEGKAKVKLPKLTITRDVILKSDVTVVNAATIILTPELSENKTAFRYVLKDKMTYKYSKARTEGSYDYIDVSIKIQFKSVTVNKDKYEISDLRTTLLSIPMVKVGVDYIPVNGKTIVSGWIPLLPKSSVIEKKLQNTPSDVSIKEVPKDVTDKSGKTETTVTTVTKETTKSTDYSKETVVDMTTNAGLYEIEVTVTETNPYKIKAENKQQLIENTGDKGAEVLKAIIEQALKKDEPESEE